MNKRFFFSQDNDSHWYIVEDDHRREWAAWCESADERVPAYAREIDHPRRIAIQNPTDQDGNSLGWCENTQGTNAARGFK